MAEQKILISIKINDREAANTQKQLKVTKDNFHSLTDAEKEKIIADKQLALSAKEVDQALTLQAKAANTAAQATKQGRTQSGLNNAILLETGRLASDASYGFTAIANNLSQVVTLFSSFVKTQGSVGESFRELGKSIMGTGGLLIGVQLLISFGPKLMDMFMRLIGQTMKLSDVFKDASKEVTGTAGKFETYTKTLQDSSKSQQEQQDAINSLKKEFPDYIKQLDDAGLTLDDVAKGTKEAREENDIYRESIVKLAMARAAQNKIDEEAAKQVQAETDLRIKAREDFGKSTEDLQKLEAKYEKFKEENTQKGRAREKALTKTFTSEEKQILRLIRARNKEVEEAQKNIDTLIEFTDIEDDAGPGGGGGGKAKVRFRNLRSARTDYDKFIEKARKKDLKDEQLTAFEKLELQKQLALDELDIQQQKFVEKEKQRRDDYIKDLQLQKDSKLEQAKSEAEKKTITIEFERAKQDAIAKTAQAMQQSAESFSNAAIRIGDSYDNIINRFLEEEELQDLAGFGKALQKGNEDRLAAQESFLSSYTDSEIDRVEVAKEIEATRFSSEMANLNSIRDARIAEGQSTLEIDQQILNAEASNSEAKIALAEAEKDAKIGIANQVGQAIVTVAGEGSTVGKAASIAMAIMNTKEAFTAALGAKPYGAWNIAQAAATLAMGFKQVKDIMAVKIPGKDPSSGGLGGGGNVIQAPDFNVVGASQTSQLAQTVAEQQAKPVKAFVVGKDISTQQELDRNITNTASFG
jgi:hypothetical protein